MDSRCKLEHQPSQPTLTIRFRAPLALLLENFGRSYCAIGKYLAELGMSPAGPAFAIYHNTDVADLEVEAGFAVARAVPDARPTGVRSVIRRPQARALRGFSWREPQRRSE